MFYRVKKLNTRSIKLCIGSGVLFRSKTFVAAPGKNKKIATEIIYK